MWREGEGAKEPRGANSKARSGEGGKFWGSKPGHPPQNWVALLLPGLRAQSCFPSWAAFPNAFHPATSGS